MRQTRTAELKSPPPLLKNMPGIETPSAAHRNAKKTLVERATHDRPRLHVWWDDFYTSSRRRCGRPGDSPRCVSGLDLCPAVCFCPDSLASLHATFLPYPTAPVVDRNSEYEPVHGCCVRHRNRERTLHACAQRFPPPSPRVLTTSPSSEPSRIPNVRGPCGLSLFQRSYHVLPRLLSVCAVYLFFSLKTRKEKKKRGADRAREREQTQGPPFET